MAASVASHDDVKATTGPPSRPLAFVLGRSSVGHVLANPIGGGGGVPQSGRGGGTASMSASPPGNILWSGPSTASDVIQNEGEVPHLLEIDGILIALLAFGHTEADVSLLCRLAKLMSLPSEVAAWEPHLHRMNPKTHGHKYCYKFNVVALGRECVHAPKVAFEKAFSPCSLRCSTLNSLTPKETGLAMGILANYPLITRTLNTAFRNTLSNAPPMSPAAIAAADASRSDPEDGQAIDLDHTAADEGEAGTVQPSAQDLKIVSAVLVGACLMGNLPLVRHFSMFFNKTVLQLANYEGVTPFHAASQSRNVALMQFLLDRLLSPEVRLARLLTQNNFKENCLNIAVRVGDPRMCEFLLNEGCPPDASVICGSLRKEELHDFADLLLAIQGSDPRGMSALNRSESPLVAACSILTTTDRFAFKLLDVQHADPNHGRDSRGMSPLHLAVEAGNVQLVRRLLEKGASANSQTSKKDTPLHILARVGPNDERSVDIARLLFWHQADGDLRCDSPVHPTVVETADFYEKKLLADFLRRQQNPQA